MIYIFYTALTLGTVIALGTIYSQALTIERLKQLYKTESRDSNKYHLELLKARAEIRSLEEVRTLWANKAHELNDEIRQRHMEHEGEIEILKGAIWKAEEFQRRVREQKRNYMRKIREARKK